MTDILAITLFYPPHHLGGYEIACQSALTALAERGHRVHVLTSDFDLGPDVGGPDPDEDGAAEEITVDRSLRSYVDRSTLLRPSVRDRWRIERRNQAVLAATLDAVRPEVISVWHMGAMSHGLLTTIVERRLPAVAMIADDWLRYGIGSDPWASMFTSTGRARLPRAVAGRLLRPLVGVPTTVADFGAHAGFLFTSADTRSRAEAGSSWRFPRAALSYLGIDDAPFRAAARRDRMPGTLLYAGRCDPRKGIETVVRALVHLPDTRLEIRSPDADGDHGDALRRTAAALGVDDRIEWAPAIPQRALAERMGRAEAVVFPSTWPEPFGLVPLEAMAAGTPVIATGVGGSDEFLVDGVNCVRFAPGDDESLAAAVGRLRDDPTLADRIIAHGQSTADFFGRERFATVVEAWHVAAAAGWSGPLPAGRRFDPAGLATP